MVAAIQPAAAQAPAETVNVDVSECVKLTTPEERLACFDKQVESTRTSPAAPATPASATSPAAPVAAPTNSQPPASSTTSSNAGRQNREEQHADIHARIREIHETVPNSYLITLDNGQVWRQTVPKAYALRHGDAVRLFYSRWGTYRLTNEQLRSFIQVERVR